jgi:hypothetical protein
MIPESPGISAMPIKTTLTVSLAATALALAAFVFVTVLSAVPAHAADMPARTVGELFDGRPVHPKHVYVEDAPRVIQNPIPYAPGYYGRMGDFAQGSYYGSSIFDIYTRAPYACFPSFYGTC